MLYLINFKYIHTIVSNKISGLQIILNNAMN